MRRLALVLAVAVICIVRAVALPADPPVDAKLAAQFEKQWSRMQQRPPNQGARDIYGFLLTAVARNWRPETWDAIVALGEELHDRDPASPTYGNYRWYWREPKPNDRNAVEFSMQNASLAWAAYRDRLPPPARDRLAAALALGAEGLVRHKVNVSYTNIFLMRLANCILIGESTDRPDLVAKGESWLDEWLAYTRQNGIHEFSSPTYYGTDLTDLGALANFAKNPTIRAKAEAALRLLWIEIAANWFEPYQGIAGAHSRDYGFLTGHGYLDQQLQRAGWLREPAAGEMHPAIDDLTFVAPPPGLREAQPVPRFVCQRWGANLWERASHYVGREFTLGSSGAGYGAQDKVLALTLAGGPKMPIVAFSLDYRRDPYGRSRMATADGHSKLTHLLPFVASVQRGPEALLVSAYDPAHSANPAGGKAPITYAGVEATFVLPSAAELWFAESAVPAGPRIPVAAHQPVFIRYRGAAAALLFVDARNDAGEPAAVAIVRDGEAVGALRLSATLASGTPTRPVMAAVWVCAADGITTDESFAAFRRAAVATAAQAKSAGSGELTVSVPGRVSPLRLVVDPSHNRRIATEGADPAADAGILAVDGRDIGGPLLAAPAPAIQK